MCDVYRKLVFFDLSTKTDKNKNGIAFTFLIVRIRNSHYEGFFSRVQFYDKRQNKIKSVQKIFFVLTICSNL